MHQIRQPSNPLIINVQGMYCFVRGDDVEVEGGCGLDIDPT